MAKRRSQAIVFASIFFGSVIFMLPYREVHATNWSRCTVEQGETSIANGVSSTTVNLTTAISDTTQAFVLTAATGSGSVRQGDDHMVSSEIASATTVNLQRTGSTGLVYVSYSVIQCYENEFSVQAGTATIAAGSTSTTATLAIPADTALSFVLVSTTTNDDGPTEVNSLATAALQDSSTVIVQRSGSSSYAVEAKYQVVSFNSAINVSVQTNEVTLSSGSQSIADTLTTPVDVSRSFIYCSYDATNNGLQQTAVACSLTNQNTVTIRRHAASAYTNRARYYVITWPADTVTVQSGSESNDPSAADGDRVDHDIAISVDSVDRAFSYVTTTVSGTSTLYPRNRWLSYVLGTTSLRTSFFRSDETGDTDANTKYWQVVQFPSPYRAEGWGWIGNSEDGTNGTALISFSCENLTGYYLTSCGDGTGVIRFDYGVYLQRGGCGADCDVNGTAWVGSYDSSDSAIYPIGIISFDPDVSDASAPPQQLGDDYTTPEDERQDARWNEETGELYGWARFLTLEAYERETLGLIGNEWGWIKLRGLVGGSTTEYGVRFDPQTLEFSGWSWNDNGSDSTGFEVEGSGLGWIKFDLLTSGTVTQSWLKTSQGNVYSGGNINASIAPPSGEYNATYLILAGGTDIINFSADVEKGNTNVNTNLGTYPTNTNAQVYRGALGTIHVNELIADAQKNGTAETGDCNDTWLANYTTSLDGVVYYCPGNLTINNNLTFYNASGSGIGSGTVVVGGNLIINDNMGYFNTTIDQHINNLASVAFIVLGRIEINPSATNLVGAYIVLGDAGGSTTGTYDFSTGDSTSPLEIEGLVMARSFNFQRKSTGTSTQSQPAEHIRYDGRIFANTPPGLEDLAALLPTFN